MSLSDFTLEAEAGDLDFSQASSPHPGTGGLFAPPTESTLGEAGVTTEQKAQLLRALNDPTANSQIRLTYNVAQEMNARKLWRFYLSDQEHVIFEAALASVETWQSFISLDGKFGSQLEGWQDPAGNTNTAAAVTKDSDRTDDSPAQLDNDSRDAGMMDESGDHIEHDRRMDSPSVTVKQEMGDQDQSSGADIIIKREESLSVTHSNSPSVSTPNASTPNDQASSSTSRSHHTPSHHPGDSALLANGSLTATEERPSSPAPETIITSTTPPASIPTTAFRSRVMVFEQLLPKLYPGQCACCHPVVDVTDLANKDISEHLRSGACSLTNKATSHSRTMEDDDYDGMDSTNAETNQHDGTVDKAKEEAVPESQAKPGKIYFYFFLIFIGLIDGWSGIQTSL